MTTKFEELEKLAKLKEQWIFSDEEFEVEKKKILSWNTFNSFSNNQENYSWYSTYYTPKWEFIEFFLSSKWRINRIQFLLSIIGHLLFLILPSAAITILMEINETIWNIFILMYIIMVAFIIYSMFITNIKRIHDIGSSWWWSIMTVMSAPLSTLFFLIIPWTNWDNQYWPKK